jgi:hypothetical protein
VIKFGYDDFKIDEDKKTASTSLLQRPEISSVFAVFASVSPELIYERLGLASV